MVTHRIRASMLNDGQICPGKLELEAHVDGGDTLYTSIGKAGHAWLEIMVLKGRKAADEYLANTEHWDTLHDSLVELVEWIDETGLVPSGKRLPEWPFRWQIASSWFATGTLDLLVIDPPRATVIDWKFYNQPDMLVPMHQDMQMYAYAVGVKRHFQDTINHVTVHRVLCYYLTKHSLELDVELLGMADRAVAELCETISTNCTDFKVGAQCSNCFQQADCKVYQARASDIQTRELQPYDGGEFASEAQALQFLIAAPLITKRLEQGYDAVKKLIADSGRPVADLASGRVWGPRTAARDTIVDAAACLGELMSHTGQPLALAAAKTSKKAMENALQQAGIKPKERRRFIERLREHGHIEKREGEPRYDWRRLKQ